MVSGRVGLILAGMLGALSACGGQATHRKPTGSSGTAGMPQAGASAEGGTSGDTGGTAGLAAGTAGTPATGGAGSSGAPGGSAGSSSGGAGGSGLGGAAFGGAAGRSGPPDIPGATDREREILASLGTDDATLEATSGAALIDLAEAISLARGYAMCRCTLTPDMPPEDFEDTLDCAREERGLRYLNRPDEARCMEEGSSGVPGFDAALRCQVRWLLEDGNTWMSTCFTPGLPWMPPSGTCMDPPEVISLAEECLYVTYCASGERVTGLRCDQAVQCPDESDELGCFDVRERDWFWCDPELVNPREICNFEMACGLEKEPPVCDPKRTDSYLCNDGGVVSTDLVCNRVADCGDGSDERYCFK
jgi:hypothetical protein